MMWGNTAGQLFVTENGNGDCIRQIDTTDPRFSNNYICGIVDAGGIWGSTDGTLYFIGDQRRRLVRSRAIGQQEIMIGPPDGYDDDHITTYSKFGSVDYGNGIWVDSLNGVYYTVQWPSKVMYYNPATKIVTPIAGSSDSGYFNDAVPGTSSMLQRPMDVWGDSNGNIFIADTQNYRVRKVDPNGIIYTVVSFQSGDGGPATNAYFSNPSGIWADSSGNSFVVDRGNCTIRKIDSDGIILTIVGYYSCGYGDDGGPANSTQITSSTYGFWGDSNGNYYYLDSRNLRKINTNNIVSTLYRSVINDKDPISVLADPQHDLFLAGDNAGNLYVGVPYQHVIKRYDISGNAYQGIFAGVYNQGGYNGDGLFATEATLNSPAGIWIDSLGNAFIADYNNNRIRKVEGSSGYISTIAGGDNSGYNGDHMPATNAYLNGPCSISGDNEGNLFVADASNQRIRILMNLTGTQYLIDTVLGGYNNYIGSPDYLGSPIYVWARDRNHLLVMQQRYGYNILSESTMVGLAPNVTAGVSPIYHTAARRSADDSIPTKRPTLKVTSPANRAPISAAYSSLQEYPTESPYDYPSNYNPVYYATPQEYPTESPYDYPSNYNPVYYATPQEYPTESPYDSPSIYYPTTYGNPYSQPYENPTYRPTIPPTYHSNNIQLTTRVIAGGSHPEDCHLYTIWGDSNGNLYTDGNGRCIRKISDWGRKVTHIAGNYSGLSLVDGLPAKDVYFSSVNKIWGDTVGNLFFTCQECGMVAQIVADTGLIKVVATLDRPYMMWGNTAGQLFVTERSYTYQDGHLWNCINQYDLDATNNWGFTTNRCQFQNPAGVWGDSSGYLYVVFPDNGRIYKTHFYDTNTHEILINK